MIKLKSIVQEIINEWHTHAKLEAYVNQDRLGWEFWFYRNGHLAGEIILLANDGRLIGFGVRKSLQGTGIGKSMLNYAFEKTNLPLMMFASSANQFYHKSGADRSGKNNFVLKRDKLKPSSIKFQDIDKETKDIYDSNNKPFDT